MSDLVYGYMAGRLDAKINRGMHICECVWVLDSVLRTDHKPLSLSPSIPPSTCSFLRA